MSASEQAGAIRRLWPDPSGELGDAEIVASLRTDEPVLRVNFVSSVDGAVTHDGRSGGLSDEADKRHFELLRRVCGVVLVGAGTVRDEGYGPMRVSAESAGTAIGGMRSMPIPVMRCGGSASTSMSSPWTMPVKTPRMRMTADVGVARRTPVITTPRVWSCMCEMKPRCTYIGMRRKSGA